MPLGRLSFIHSSTAKPLSGHPQVNHEELRQPRGPFPLANLLQMIDCLLRVDQDCCDRPGNVPCRTARHNRNTSSSESSTMSTRRRFIGGSKTIYLRVGRCEPLKAAYPFGLSQQSQSRVFTCGALVFWYFGVFTHSSPFAAMQFLPSVCAVLWRDK